ncbi:tetraspanin-8-like [Alosa pseudoharengus]|uniref:tetraspanin-8-like n=1 Tax=Alosa pseudoharengus TaxID=34774 RepID=UPI003F8874E6
MANGSVVLRNIFGFFNLLFAIFGVLVIVLALVVHVHLNNVQEFGQIAAVFVLYVIGFITLAISFLGAYGAFRQVKWMLVVFLVLMCVGFLFLVCAAGIMAFLQSQINQEIEQAFNKMGPLDQTSEDFKKFMDGLQKSMQCCGAFNGSSDWNDHVPESCDCSPSEKAKSDTCVALPGYSIAVFSNREESGRFVYKQSCGPLFLDILNKLLNITTGILFGLTALTFLGIAISSCLIHHINKSRNAGVVLAPAFVFSTEPPKYNMLVNEPYH